MAKKTGQGKFDPQLVLDPAWQARQAEDQAMAEAGEGVPMTDLPKWVDRLTWFIAEMAEQLQELRTELPSHPEQASLSTRIAALEAKIQEVTDEKEQAEAALARAAQAGSQVALMREARKRTAGPANVWSFPKRDSKREAKRVELTEQILASKPTAEETAYQHLVMCQVGLPRSKVQGDRYERKVGGASILIRSGELWNGTDFVKQPIPYGANPRIILAWLNTQAVLTGSPTIDVGDSASEFLKMLGKGSSTGGEKGSLTAFRNQVAALAACSLTLGYSVGTKAFTYNGQPISEFEAWINPNGRQKALWPGIIKLSDGYFHTLLEAPVPVDMRALVQLQGKPMAMDIYNFLAYRMHALNRKGEKNVVLRWANLREQFGASLESNNAHKDFKKQFVPALKLALQAYPQARVSDLGAGGIMLLPSPTPVPGKK